MVAYSFNKRFVPMVRDGMKLQTVRAHRKRHAQPGERLQLYFGMRTKHCKKIVADPICTAVLPIEIAFDGDQIARILVGQVPVRCLNDFAILDGFKCIEDMSAFWANSHGAGKFEGVVIEWAPDSISERIAA